MPHTVEHYESVIRRQREGTDSKLRAVLRAYAQPAARFNPAACLYNRTFALEIIDILDRTTGKGMGALVDSLNDLFKTGAAKDRIKFDGDFHRTLRAMVTTVPGLIVMADGPGNLIRFTGSMTVPIIAELRSPSSPHFCLESIPAAKRVLFLELNARLHEALSLPVIDESTIESIRSDCAIEASRDKTFSFVDLLKFHHHDSGETALHALIQGLSKDGYMAAKRYVDDFIARGIDPNITDSRGRTALLKAAMIENSVMAEHLHYKHAADPTLKSGRRDGRESTLDYMYFAGGRAISVDLASRSTPTRSTRSQSLGSSIRSITPTMEAMSQAYRLSQLVADDDTSLSK